MRVTQMAERTTVQIARPASEPPAAPELPRPIGLGQRVANLVAVIVPILGLVAAVMFLWGRGFSWVDLGLLLGMYAVTAVGITVGFHRLFTHRSFETNRMVQFVLAALGSMAGQGPLLKWVAFHRRSPPPPGPPHRRAPGGPRPAPPPGGAAGGAVGRAVGPAPGGGVPPPAPPHLSRYVKDLRQSRLLRYVSALFPLWVLAGLTIPTVLG